MKSHLRSIEHPVLRRLRQRSACVSVLVVALAACGLNPRTFEVGFAPSGSVDALSVVLVDHTGLVTGLDLPPQPSEDWREGVRNGAGRPDSLVVGWLGGMCDRRATLTLDEVPGGYRITRRMNSVDRCLLAGIGRIVVVSLSRPVASDSVQLEPGG
jgi:hypothetical protein